MKTLRTEILDILYAHRGEWLNATAIRSLLGRGAGRD